MNGACNRTFFGHAPLGPGEGPNFNYKVNFKIFKANFVCLLTNERYKKYQTGFSFGRLGHAPGVALGDTVGGWRGGQKNVLRNSIRFGVCYLHNWHMQRHHFFLVPTPWGLWKGQKLKYNQI